MARDIDCAAIAGAEFDFSAFAVSGIRIDAVAAITVGRRRQYAIERKRCADKIEVRTVRAIGANVDDAAEPVTAECAAACAVADPEGAVTVSDQRRITTDMQRGIVAERLDGNVAASAG